MWVRSGSGSHRTRCFWRRARIEAAAYSVSPSALSTPSVSPPRRQCQPPGRLPTTEHVLSVGLKRHQTPEIYTVLKATLRPSSGFSQGMFLLTDSGFYRKLQEVAFKCGTRPRINGRKWMDGLSLIILTVETHILLLMKRTEDEIVWYIDAEWQMSSLLFIIATFIVFYFCDSLNSNNDRRTWKHQRRVSDSAWMTSLRQRVLFIFFYFLFLLDIAILI